MSLLIMSHSAGIVIKLFPEKTCMRINTNHIMATVLILLVYTVIRSEANIERILQHEVHEKKILAICAKGHWAEQE